MNAERRAGLVSHNAGMTPLPKSSSPSIPASIEAIQGLSIVPLMLETVCALAGMRFAAIARVTDERWTACAVLDHLNFGLKPGGDLVLNSTICDEIRVHHQPVIFGSASAHPIYSTHHTPRIYGLENYVSVPILTEGGQFFGTLCAIDWEPRNFDESTIVSTLCLFASLIASNLSLEARAMDAETALKTEMDTGLLREQFLAVVGHDLRSPLQAALLATDAPWPPSSMESGGWSDPTLKVAALLDDDPSYIGATITFKSDAMSWNKAESKGNGNYSNCEKPTYAVSSEEPGYYAIKCGDSSDFDATVKAVNHDKLILNWFDGGILTLTRTRSGM